MAEEKNFGPSDSTPMGADISRLKNSEPNLPQQRMSPEENDAAKWQAVAASESFRRLVKAKRRFIIPAMIFFIVYYFALPVLVGYARPLMETRVIGAVNLAYLFALSQFFMAWIIAALYVRAAARFDKMSRDIVDKIDPPQSE